MGGVWDAEIVLKNMCPFAKLAGFLLNIHFKSYEG